MKGSFRREQKIWQLLNIVISLLPIFGKSFKRYFSPSTTFLVSADWSSNRKNIIPRAAKKAIRVSILGFSGVWVLGKSG
ncbi:hypothetical protein A946_10740 [Methylacidiphilum kamchatkense Kam1]|uniref:Uncharacterized protein n=1 Tax=Methylacidiphilum kamchatkense Kam1 TaxID=1202785 RepID=A0A0C1RSK3_9BACT|nr:hypothetical protein [Methylacidiphilum kamchatkense]KIE57911.1 hypothetical protein A946_10740 [Methylacidiphilum kamchatkense Kam1]QDQ41415.1 hypothetical protein kam1_158 [Methylacidiphilum kamchatkense Kam1]